MWDAKNNTVAVTDTNGVNQKDEGVRNVLQKKKKKSFEEFVIYLGRQ